jgi:hypothetical protein
VVIEDDGKLVSVPALSCYRLLILVAKSNACAPRPDDPAGLVGFRQFVDQVLGIGQCMCSRCSIHKVAPANPLHVAVQCTTVRYTYKAYGNVNSERIIRINPGQPVF